MTAQSHSNLTFSKLVVLSFAHHEE